MLRQGLQQRMLQKLSPQQIQLMKLLQIPAIALEQRIKEELQENPALEEGLDADEDFNEQEELDYEDSDNDLVSNDDIDSGDSDPIDDSAIKNAEDYFDDVAYYKLNANNKSADDERTESPIALSTSFQDGLYAQLYSCNFDEQQYFIAEYILGNMDDDGYIRRPLSSIIDDLAFSQNIMCEEQELLDILKVIQTFEPIGVGARDLQECLLIQLDRKNGAAVEMAKIIIRDYMEEFSKKHYDKILKHLDLTDVQLKDAISEVLKLNPKPGDSLQDGVKSAEHVIPDFIITNNDGVLELSLNAKNAPDLKISRAYVDMMETYSKDKRRSQTAKEAANFVKQKIESAKWFIDAINQRQQTLFTTMSAIMKYQYDYFLEGDETKLKPMILKDIADTIGLDISTVSRVANSKYVQTHFGTLLLKSFFSEAMHTDTGEEVSSREVKKILSDSIAAENKKKPITDEALAKVLQNKGYEIARRTVAKYREQLNIPVARMRKEL
jgi:RNA polymerase sigma-54 factor